MKLTIKKGPVSLELSVASDILIKNLKDLIFKSIPIPQDFQILNSIISGEIIKLEENYSLAYYEIPENSTIYLDEAVSPLSDRHKTLSILDSDNNSLEYWAEKALNYCKTSSLEKFLRLKHEFNLKYESSKVLSLKSIVNYLSGNNWTCIHYACKVGHSGLLQELISLGADCNLVTSDHWTPLIIASSNGYLLCVQLILSQPNIEINKVTERGSALHAACVSGRSKIVKLLLDFNAQVNIEDKNGKIPLECTEKKSIVELIPKYIGKELLVKYFHANTTNKPSNYTGELFWVASWQINDKLVMLVLDVDSGNLLQYNKKANFMENLPPDQIVPLCDIQDIKNVEESSTENKYFIHIHTEKEIFKYYSKNIEICSCWAKTLQDSINYFKLSTNTESESEGNIKQLFSITGLDEMNFQEDDVDDMNQPVSFASFEILNEIGEGTFGKVFKVIKKTSGMRYAMKTISKLELKRNGQYKYVVSECKIQKSLNHPFIVKMHWAFQTPNNIYMISEFCASGDLSNLLKKENNISERTAKIYLSQIVLALEYLHSKDIFFRDLKLQNILIDEFNNVKLCDFGLARENTNKSNPAFTFCGSPGYIAPEIIKNDPIFKPADIYSLGVCLYELLTGSLPFHDVNLIKLYKKITSGKIIYPNHISNSARSLISQLTQKNPEKRPKISEIKSHQFFDNVDWELIYNTQTCPLMFHEEALPAHPSILFEDNDYSKAEDQAINSLLK